MSRDQATDWDLQRDQATALERIATALETMAAPKDHPNLGLALQLKAAEERAAARLMQLQAVKEILGTPAVPTEREERAIALLETVLPDLETTR